MGALIYANPLASRDDITDFRLEGPGTASFPRGRLRLESTADPDEGQAANLVLWCDARFGDGLDSIGAATMERWFSPGFIASGAAAPWQRMLERQPLDGYAACCEAIAAADLRGDAARLRLPVQLIAGARDGSTPPDLVGDTARLIADARFDVIPDAGHIPCVETPAAHAAILARFMKEIGHV